MLRVDYTESEWTITRISFRLKHSWEYWEQRTEHENNESCWLDIIQTWLWLADLSSIKTQTWLGLVSMTWDFIGLVSSNSRLDLDVSMDLKPNKTRTRLELVFTDLRLNLSWLNRDLTSLLLDLDFARLTWDVDMARLTLHINLSRLTLDMTRLNWLGLVSIDLKFNKIYWVLLKIKLGLALFPWLETWLDLFYLT